MDMVSKTLARFQAYPIWTLVLGAVLVGLLGTREMVDGIGLWIVDFVNGLPNDSWYRPFHPPPPSYGYGFRPVSILMVKSYIAVFGTQSPPPLWFLFGKIAFSAFTYGFGCWLWLKSVNRPRIALTAGLIGMVLGPHLFSLWYLTEFDGLGAASTLVASAILLQENRSRNALIALGSCILFTIFLKESSALLLFGVLGVHGIYFGLQTNKNALWTTVIGLVSALSVWLALAWQVVTGHVDSHFSGLSTELRWLIVGFTASQLTVFVSLVGTGLIALLALDSICARWTGWKWVILAFVISTFVWPPVATINHYETYYFDQMYWMLGGGIVLNLALLGVVLQGKTHPMRALSGLLLLSMEITMAMALIVSANPREDIASRLFLAGFPPLVLLFWDATRQLMAHFGQKLMRLTFTLAPSMAIGFVCMHSLNILIAHHARNQVDVLGHQKLGSALNQEDLVIFDNFVYWLSRDTLAGISKSSIAVEDSQLIYLPTQLKIPSFPKVNWGTDMDLEARHQNGDRIWWYSLQQRSKMDAASNAYLKGQFQNLKFPFGLFKPFSDGQDDSPMPTTNYMEDSRSIIYGQHPSPLSQLISSRGNQESAVGSDFIQVSTQINEWPRRVLTGVPIVEHYRYQVELWVMNDN